MRAAALDALTSDNGRPSLGSIEGPRAHPPEATRMRDRADLLQGTLDLLVLKSLALAPLHGWGISKRIRQLSGDALQVNQGSLYPALYRLVARGWLACEWRTTENNRNARYYDLTDEGRAQLAAEREQWSRLSRGVNLIMGLDGARA